MNPSSISTIGRLSKVPLREVWKHEAHDFTAWLADNLDILRDAIGFDLTFVAREQSVGPFSADIVAEDPAGRSVIIENQLEQTDHDHLGKMITYMSNLEARAAIWITSVPRPEHEKAVQWLNEFLPADVHFYLLQVEAVRIGESPAAPLFSMVAGPSDISAAIGDQKKETAERLVLREQFWTELLQKLRGRVPFYDRVNPSDSYWLAASAGKSGLTYSFLVRTFDSSVELNIDTPESLRNKEIFDLFMTRRHAIESAFGAPLEWQRMETKRKCRISYVLENGGLRDKESWPPMQDALIDAMIRLERAFKAELASIR